jgi:hypothetical protein
MFCFLSTYIYFWVVSSTTKYYTELVFETYNMLHKCAVIFLVIGKWISACMWKWVQKCVKKIQWMKISTMLLANKSSSGWVHINEAWFPLLLSLFTHLQDHHIWVNEARTFWNIASGSKVMVWSQYQILIKQLLVGKTHTHKVTGICTQ